MPRKPKKPCAYPGCAELIEAGQRYCEKHKKTANKEYEHYHRGYKASERYNYSWRLISKRYRELHPLCEECLKHDRFTPAQLVHHKLPLDEGGTNDFDNLMSLCNSCHTSIHNKMKR